MKYCFGIDIGGTTVKMGLFQEDGELLDKWEIKTRTENQGEAILPDIAQAVKAKMAEKKLVKEQIIGLGMGLPAPFHISPSAATFASFPGITFIPSRSSSSSRVTSLYPHPRFAVF